MPEIKLTIDCKGNTCGVCQLLTRDYGNYDHVPRCIAFFKYPKQKGNDYERLQDCLDAQALSAGIQRGG